MPLSPRLSTGRLLAGGSSLAFLLALNALAFAQEGRLEGLRGAGTNLSGDELAAPGGANSGAGVAPAGTPNYGKPRPRVDPKSKYPGQRKATGRPLPPLTPYGAAAARQQRATPSRLPPGPTVAALPIIPVKPRPAVEADPFAPIGVPIGSLRLVPYVEVSGGYDSNPERVNAPLKGSATLRGEVGAAWKSDWSVHELKGDVKAGYTKYFSAPLADRPDAQGKMNLRLDATRDTAFDFELRGQLDTQRPGSTELAATSVKSRPIVASFGATAGATHKIGDLELGLHGTIDRTAYEDATLNNGSKLLLNGNSFNTYGLRGRAGYQITPGVTPFVEVGADVRRHDQAIDSAGFARDSAGGSARAGTTFEASRILTGEVAAGYAQRKYSDGRLPTLSGPTFDAALVWTASPLTTVSLRGATTLAETTVANASGAVGHAVTLDVSHALLRNLTLGATGTVGVNEYRGVNLRETTVLGTLRAEYKLNRSVSVRGSFTHERLKSTTPGSDYTANVFLLGLKFQR